MSLTTSTTLAAKAKKCATTRKITTLMKVFFDEDSKKIHRHVYVTPSLDKSKHNATHLLRCMFCTLSIDASIDPIGCPIDMIDHKKEDGENVKNIDWILSTEFVTEGIFCSFNCAKAFAGERSHDPKYKNSARLLAFMLSYTKYGSFSNPVKIVPSPSPYLMSVYGGVLSESEYVDSIGKITYTDKGSIFMFPVTSVFARADEM
jgi:hypothetical protein